MAKALAKRGVAAFVLKYRLRPTPESMPAFEVSIQKMFSAAAKRPVHKLTNTPLSLALQLEDTRAAFALIRNRAVEWHIKTNRIGMIGFSAGAMLTLATGLENNGAKPAFIGIIYGPLTAVPVQNDAPPMFVALAADDPFFGKDHFDLIDSWRTAKRPVEFHFYEQGGHGFGMYQKTTTSTGWFEDFTHWMGMHQWLQS